AAMLAVLMLAVGHVFMVFAVDPYAIRSMTTGGYDPGLSPEARNARPFHHLLPRHRDWRATRHAPAGASAVDSTRHGGDA
ncbi:MAG TPA: hypothetical protein VE861_12560, partial [Gemmatimonadaceae bacterium]|nr:hypothetical protein [Gemmatimonadaceae bacterium]